MATPLSPNPTSANKFLTDPLDVDETLVVTTPSEEDDDELELGGMSSIHIGLITAVTVGWVIWVAFVIAGVVFFARSVSKPGEKFRVSLAFVLLSVFFPFLSIVPITLNINE